MTNDQPLPPEIPALEEHRRLISILAESLLNRSLRSKLDPEDLVQETMQRAYAKFSTVKDPNNSAVVKKWLREIFRNVLIDLVKKYNTDRRDINLERSMSDEIDRSSACIEGWIAAQHTSPSMAAARNEELAKLEEALKRLPEDQRFVVVEMQINNKTAKEIAESSGKTVAAVCGLLRRGLAGLRDSFA